MSSTAVASVPGSLPAEPEILHFPLGTDSAVSASVNYRKHIDPSQPSQDELKLAYKLLDIMLQNVPFEHWED